MRMRAQGVSLAGGREFLPDLGVAIPLVRQPQLQIGMTVVSSVEHVRGGSRTTLQSPFQLHNLTQHSLEVSALLPRLVPASRAIKWDTASVDVIAPNQ